MIEPRYVLTIGDRIYEHQVHSLRCSRSTAPGIGRLAVELPYRDEQPIAVGDDLTLDLDAGDQAVPGASGRCFTGVVTAVQSITGGLEVRAGDSAHLLAGQRRATTYEGQSAGDVTADLCAQAGIETGPIDPGPTLPVYVADGWTTAWEHIGRLAAMSGSTATVDGDGRVRVTAEQPVMADVAIRAGRELLAVTATEAAPAAFATRMVGEGPGPVDDRPGALRFRASLPTGSGSPGVAVTMAALRDRTVVSEATEAAAGLDVGRRQRVELTTWLQPQIEPGCALEIQDTAVPIPLLSVARVAHLIGAVGRTTPHRPGRVGSAAITRITATAAPSDDLLGLLGDLLGGFGSLGGAGAAAGAIGGLR